MTFRFVLPNAFTIFRQMPLRQLWRFPLQENLRRGWPTVVENAALKQKKAYHTFDSILTLSKKARSVDSYNKERIAFLFYFSNCHPIHGFPGKEGYRRNGWVRFRKWRLGRWEKCLKKTDIRLDMKSKLEYSGKHAHWSLFQNVEVFSKL